MIDYIRIFSSILNVRLLFTTAYTRCICARVTYLQIKSFACVIYIIQNVPFSGQINDLMCLCGLRGSVLSWWPTGHVM